jgi:pimeloyl-[acyl-carrier protein] methyl ester esterase
MFIHTETYGSGEPLVLFHGWAMHSGIWRSFAKQLAQHYQVICVDLPGHGHSQPLPEFTLAAISSHLVKILPTTACTLIGWSLGGMVALDLANRFPERIKKLVMIGSNPYFVKTANWAGMKPLVLEKFAADLTADCHGTLVRFLSLQVNGLDNYKAVLKELKTALQACEPPTATILQSGLAVLQQQDLRPQLAQLQCPAHVILGTHDTLVPVAVAEQIQQLNSNLKLTVIDKAAHVPFLSHPETLITLLKNFMERADAV